MFKKCSLQFLAFLQATGLVLYIAAIDLFIVTAGDRLNSNVPSFYGPILFLLLFIISAVISASLVLGKTGILFWEKKYKESFTLLGWTVGWCILYFVLFFIIILVNQTS